MEPVVHFQIHYSVCSWTQHLKVSGLLNYSWNKIIFWFWDCVCMWWFSFYWTVGSPSEFGRARYLVEFPGPSVAPAGPSKDTLLPQLLTNGREKKQNVLHKRRAGKIPRPPNAFMIFANEWRRKLAFQHPCKSFRFVEEHVLGLIYYCVFHILHSFYEKCESKLICATY